MDDLKKKLDKVYITALQPFQHLGARKNTEEFRSVFTRLMKEFLYKINSAEKSLITEHPEQKHEIRKYVMVLKNKLLDIYRR